MKKINKILILILSISLIKTTTYAMKDENKKPSTSENSTEEKTKNKKHKKHKKKSKNDKTNSKNSNQNQIIINEEEFDQNQIIPYKNDETLLYEGPFIPQRFIPDETKQKQLDKKISDQNKLKEKYLQNRTNFINTEEGKNILLKFNEKLPKDKIIDNKKLEDLYDLYDNTITKIDIKIKDIKETLNNTTKITTAIKECFEKYDKIKQIKKYITPNCVSITDILSIDSIFYYMAILAYIKSSLEIQIYYINNKYKEFKDEKILNDTFINEIKETIAYYLDFCKMYNKNVAKAKEISSAFFDEENNYNEKKHSKYLRLKTDIQKLDFDFEGFKQEIQKIIKQEKKNIEAILPQLTLAQNCIIDPLEKTNLNYTITKTNKEYLSFIKTFLNFILLKKNSIDDIKTISRLNNIKLSKDFIKDLQYKIDEIENFYYCIDDYIKQINKGLDHAHTNLDNSSIMNFNIPMENNIKAYFQYYLDFDDYKNNSDVIKLKSENDKIYGYLQNMFTEDKFESFFYFLDCLKVNKEDGDLMIPKDQYENLKEIPRYLEEKYKKNLGDLFSIIGKMINCLDEETLYKKDINKIKEIIEKNEFNRIIYDRYIKKLKNYEDENLLMTHSNFPADILEYSWEQFDKNYSKIKECMENKNLFLEIEKNVPIKGFKNVFLKNLEYISDCLIRYLNKYRKIFLIENNKTIDISDLTDSAQELYDKIKEKIKEYCEFFEKFKKNLNIKPLDNVITLDKDEQKLISNILKTNKNDQAYILVKYKLIENLETLKQILNIFNKIFTIYTHTHLLYKDYDLGKI